MLVRGEGPIRPARQKYLRAEGWDLALSGLLPAGDLTGIALSSFTNRAAIWLVLGLVTLVSAATVLIPWARMVLTAFAVIGLALRDLIDLNPASPSTRVRC
ncbi:MULTISPECIES: hypothetical protein [Amycolatopsis]|uniref:hypothetical protein n=1 Tax=Amycolatopsis TaxID=1813 RepID=UPI0007E1456E|nr:MULTISPECIES: hypothetical protein [Amycolatopsis]OAP24708.1 hypothetical protein A4R44_04677 [Amycolatopsis sp. M39]